MSAPLTTFETVARNQFSQKFPRSQSAHTNIHTHTLSLRNEFVASSAAVGQPKPERPSQRSRFRLLNTSCDMRSAICAALRLRSSRLASLASANKRSSVSLDQFCLFARQKLAHSQAHHNRPTDCAKPLKGALAPIKQPNSMIDHDSELTI